MKNYLSFQMIKDHLRCDICAGDHYKFVCKGCGLDERQIRIAALQMRQIRETLRQLGGKHAMEKYLSEAYYCFLQTNGKNDVKKGLGAGANRFSLAPSDYLMMIGAIENYYEEWCELN